VNTLEKDHEMNTTANAADRNVQAATAKIIPFRSKQLLLVDNGGVPFVPMKPVVDGMGLDWKSQHAKLTAGRFSSTMVMITMVAEDGHRRKMSCLPLRKLPGWLTSIHANKVRPELREGIIAYQNECDDVLWSYWNDGLAVRTHGRNAMTVLDELIGMSELNVIKGLIRDKAKAVPVEHRLSCQQTLHSRLHTRFNVPRTELIPVEQFDAACNFVAAYALEGEWLGKEQKYRPNLSYPIATLVERRKSMLTVRNNTQAWLDVTLHDLRDIRGSETPCEKLLGELSKAGYDIEGCWWELRTYRNKVRELASFAIGLSRAIEDPHRYAVSPNSKSA
jgi:hypothetical protein